MAAEERVKYFFLAKNSYFFYVYRIMKKVPIAILLFFSLFNTIKANKCNSLHLYIKDCLLKELQETGEISRVVRDTSSLSLIPLLDEEAEIRNQVSSLEPIVGVEALLLYNPEKKDLMNQENLLNLYNTLNAVSTLEGIKYYSVRRKKMHVLFKKAYRIKCSSNPQRVPDIQRKIIPTHDRICVFFKDASFGKVYSKIDYYCCGTYFTMQMANINTLTYFFLPLIRPGNQINFIIILPVEDQILFYGLSYVHSRAFMGFIEANVASFYNRIKALFNWFKDNF